MFPHVFLPPENQDELLFRARELAGFTLGELAKKAAVPVPQNLRRAKGWVGNLIEFILGADAGSKPEQDFAHIGVELKTIPVDSAGKPLETTFVSVAPLTDNIGLVWESSYVRRKLSCVLWIPIEGERTIPVCDRKVGLPFLWRPSGQEEQILKRDWEELMDLIVLGKVDSITARYGEALHIRPKAANGTALTDAFGFDGSRILTRPRGFYLRKTFTFAILKRHFGF